VKIFKKQFKFTGGEIVNEFLMSTGFLPGAHHENCNIFKKLKKEKPMWMQNKKSGTP
jgi:DNA-3-methyladenine glycosylase I